MTGRLLRSLSANSKLLAVWVVIGSLLIAVYLADFWSPVNMAIPACYVAALLLIVSLPKHRDKIVVACVSTALTIVNFFLVPSGIETPAWIVLMGHGMTLSIVWIFAIVCINHNRSENALRLSEERFRALVEASSQIVWTTDAAGNVIEDSSSWRAFTGQTFEQWEGAGWLNAYHPNDQKRIQTNWQRAIANKTPLEAQYRLRRHDGQWRWTLVRSVPLLASDGLIRGWVGMNTDVTDRKQAEADTLFLLDLGECIRLAADPDELTWTVAIAMGEHVQVDRCGFIEIDMEDDRFTVHRDYHPHTASLAGSHSVSAFGPAIVSAGKAGQTSVVCDTAGDDRTARYADNYRRVGVGAYIAAPLLRDGQVVAALIIATTAPHEWSEREVALVTTVSERVWLAVEKLRLDGALHHSEEALREADRRKDEFLATLAHELRNPLALIRNVIQVLQLPGSSEAEMHWGRDIIDRQVSYLTRLTDDLFDVSRITREKLDLHKEPVELAEIVNVAVESCQPLITSRGHELTVTLPDKPMVVEADKVRLAQVFLNLLNNAAKYTPQPGHIWLNARQLGDHVEIRVKDTGLGISAEHLPRLFDLFYQVDRSYTRAEGGLGLGLTLVRRLVEIHGGTVKVESLGVNQGSEFIVRLPLFSVPDDCDEVHEHEDKNERLPGTARRILVADDFPESANTLAKLLRMNGNNVQTAVDGLEAFDIAAKFRPDVAVLDIAMPKLDGYEAARMIRQQPWGKHMALIALTGWGQQQDRRRTKEAGFDAHLTKPVKYEAFLELLSNFPYHARQNEDRSPPL
jgi:PAS domain S-box-containing protein